MQPRTIAEDYLGTIERDGRQVSLRREDLFPLMRTRWPELDNEAQQACAAKALDEIQQHLDPGGPRPHRSSMDAYGTDQILGTYGRS